MKKKFVFVLATALLCTCLQLPTLAQPQDPQQGLSNLEALADTALRQSGTPGMSMVMVTPERVEYRSFGYADREQQTSVTPDTLFEIGSMSKAFTALGILLLEQEGKLNLTDNVRTYVPWLSMRYEGTYKGETMDGAVPQTIAQFLYQTSGVPSETVGTIPSGGSEDMLEETVRGLIDKELAFYPGTKFSYATINYDVLGLIIQNVSGQSYESFITERILQPLGLSSTYVGRRAGHPVTLLAKGYKPNFFSIEPYDAPEFRGNTPAGYIISSAKDMGRWLQIQMGLADIPPSYKTLVDQSHIGDSTVASAGDFYYGAGWSVHLRGEQLTHGGSNPNFSSNLRVDHEKKAGLCVLTNMDTNLSGYVTDTYFQTLYGEPPQGYKTDYYRSMDFVFSSVFIGAIFLGLFYGVLLAVAVVDLIRHKRERVKRKGARVAGFLLAVPIMIFFCFCIYYLPNLLFSRMPWEAVNVWGPSSIAYGSFFGALACLLFFMYVLLTFNFPKPKEKNYVALIPLSIINGLTSALIIFTINESFNRNLTYSKELLVYFIFALAFFVYTIKLVQGRMIVITNEIAYEKRMAMIDKIIGSSYQAIEKVGASRIYSGLNNDTGAVAQIPGMVVSFASNFLTMVFCLAYLLSDSLIAFIASISVIVLNGLISFITSRISSKYWEKNRDIQDVYFGQMSDLVYGFKELLLSKLRRLAFWNDMKKYSRLSTELSKEASIKFLNFGIYNTLMYNLIFGVVVFVFPLLILDISVNGLRQTLFMVFYLIGPFGAVMGIIPGVTQIRVNWKRINQLIKELEEVSTQTQPMEQSISIHSGRRIDIQNVAFRYTFINESEQEEEFILGPINAVIESGRITYITGGNGSGKSTLGKLLTGMYQPESGSILIDGKQAGMVDLNECFSAVYSDFYLFKKLYGVDMSQRRAEVGELLALMKIDKKVELDEEGNFQSLNLSTGQKKRLAFVVCCLDNKPFMLFDEWAAEQDPAFRQYFYTELLPMLRDRGKGVVVITHDDRFFDLADQMLKLERGQLV